MSTVARSLATFALAAFAVLSVSQVAAPSAMASGAHAVHAKPSLGAAPRVGTVDGAASYGYGV